MAQDLRPEIAILDLAMPVMNGLDAAREIIRAGGNVTRVILLTVHNEPHYVSAALDAGVSGYVLKSRAATSLLEAIDEVLQGRVHLGRGVSREPAEASVTPPATPLKQDRNSPEVLSVREHQILQRTAIGMSAAAIAAELSIGVEDVETQRQRMMAKLGVTDIDGLIRYAVRRGIIRSVRN
jgi:DNA-binding NarL/FixJ family response regulator